MSKITVDEILDRVEAIGEHVKRSEFVQASAKESLLFKDVLEHIASGERGPSVRKLADAALGASEISFPRSFQ